MTVRVRGREGGMVAIKFILALFICTNALSCEMELAGAVKTPISTDKQITLDGFSYLKGLESALFTLLPFIKHLDWPSC